jgi:hypothetical protein
MAFVDWHIQQRRNSGIRFMATAQRYSGQAVAIYRHRARVSEHERHQHPRRWSHSNRRWHQP